MRLSGRRRICVGMLAALLLGADATAAPACVGDCDGDGHVGVAELIIGVRISLGETALSECAAFDTNGDGTVAIDELVTAVAAALGGCPAAQTPTVSPTPTPSATATPTSTAVDTPTPSPTPTVPIVAGRWREDPLAVSGSTCIALVTQEFADSLASMPPCDQSVTTPSPPQATLLDCTGQQVDGSLDRDGTLHFSYPQTSSTTEGCTVALSTSVSIPAAVSPTTAAYAFAVAFSGACPLADCTIDAQATWTRE